MKRRILSVLFAALLASVMLAGCKKNVGTPEDNAVQETEEDAGEEEQEEYDGYIFGYSCIDMGNPYFDTLKKSIETTLHEEEYQLISKDPGSDADLQVKQIGEMI